MSDEIQEKARIYLERQTKLALGQFNKQVKSGEKSPKVCIMKSKKFEGKNIWFDICLEINSELSEKELEEIKELEEKTKKEAEKSNALFSLQNAIVGVLELADNELISKKDLKEVLQNANAMKEFNKKLEVKP